MTVPSNTLRTASTVGIREDLEDDIYRIAPAKTPFVSALKKTKVTNILHEWQVDDLAAPDPDNANYEGDNANLNTAAQPERQGVYCQIFDQTVSIAGTVQAAKLAGRSSEWERQKLKKGVEIKRDKEARYLGNYASQAENPGVAPRKTAGVQAWAETVASRGAGGADGGWQSGGLVSAATPGTPRAFTEALVRAVLATGFSAGAMYDRGFLGPTHKQQFSQFAGIADIRVDAPRNGQAVILGAADVYQSDFGRITLIPHPYGVTDACVFMDMDYLADGTFRKMHFYELAKIGDSRQGQMIEECCLIVRNEKAVGVVADLA